MAHTIPRVVHLLLEQHKEKALSFSKEQKLMLKGRRKNVGTRLILMLILVSVLGFGYVTLAQAAGENTGTSEAGSDEAFIDPFTLSTLFSPPSSSVSGSGLSVRPWVRIPYHPHMCSLFGFHP